MSWQAAGDFESPAETIYVYPHRTPPGNLPGRNFAVEFLVGRRFGRLHLHVEDDYGFNVSSDNVAVEAYESPQIEINQGQQQTIDCPIDTVLPAPDKDEPGWSYLWPNGSVSPYINVGTTGIVFTSRNMPSISLPEMAAQ